MSHRSAAVGFIFLTVVLDVLGLGIVLPILPTLVAEVSHTAASDAARIYGIFVAIYAAMQFLCSPLLGSLSDRFGRRTVLLVSLAGAGMDYLAMSFAPTLAWLFVGRVIAGITGASFTVAQSYIADVTPPELRAQRFGLVGAAFGLGFIIGPALGGVLSQYGTRVPFIGAGCLTLLSALYGFFVLPESLAPENRRAFSWRRANPLGALAGLAGKPGLLGLAAVIVVSALASQVWPSTFVLFTAARLGFTPFQSGLGLGYYGLLAVVMQAGLIQWLMPRLGPRRALLIGMVSNFVVLVLFSGISQGWMLFPVLALGALGFLADPSAQGLASSAVGADEQGATLGAIASLNSLVGVIGPLLYTGVFGFFTSPAAPFAFAGAPFLIAAALLLVAFAGALRVVRNVPAAAPAAASQ